MILEQNHQMILNCRLNLEAISNCCYSLRTADNAYERVQLEFFESSCLRQHFASTNGHPVYAVVCIHVAPGEGFEPSRPFKVTSYQGYRSRLAPFQARRPRHGRLAIQMAILIIQEKRQVFYKSVSQSYIQREEFAYPQMVMISISLPDVKSYFCNIEWPHLLL